MSDRTMRFQAVNSGIISSGVISSGIINSGIINRKQIRNQSAPEYEFIA